MNKDSNNSYRMLDKSSNWSILNGTTTHYVKNLNTVSVRGVQDNDMSIAKVTMHQSLNFCSTSVYCCNNFDLFRIYCHLFLLLV